MENVIKVPAEAMSGAQTFAIDFGGSVLKLVYIKKTDVHPEGFVLVRQRSFSREQFPEAIDFIQRECEIPAPVNGEPKEYILTGVGTHQFQKVLKERLKIRVSTTFEMDCFKQAFRLLIENFSEEELFHAPVFEDDQSVKDLVKNLDELRKGFGVTNEDSSEEEGDPLPEAGAKWPCIMGLLGSAFLFIKIEEDGTLVRGSSGSSSNRGGRMFLGLGSLLTGAKTYEEIMELAEKGNDRNVHCYSKELIKANEADKEENLYGKFHSVDLVCYAFGWCVGKTAAEFSREDLARALLVTSCQEIVQNCVVAIEKGKVSRIILVGGFAQHPLARKFIEAEFAKVTKMAAMFDPKSSIAHATLHVMKAGSHLGALGAMLQSKPKPEGQPEAEQTNTRF